MPFHSLGIYMATLVIVLLSLGCSNQLANGTALTTETPTTMTSAGGSPAPAQRSTQSATPAAPPTPIPTVSPKPTLTATPPSTPVPTPTLERLDEVDCQDPCARDTVPLLGNVDWVEGPEISATGELSLIARIHEGHNLILPGGANGGVSNIALTAGSNLYGSVVPPSQPGWNWNPGPGLWVADTYIYRERTLTVIAQIDPAASTHSGLMVCIWSGGGAAEAYLLGCADVEQP